MARVNCSVPDDMKEWVEDQPHLNFSGLLQKAIERQREAEDFDPERYLQRSEDGD